MSGAAAPRALSTLHARLGLTRNPFPPTPDASSYFFTEALQSNLCEVLHCVEACKGFVLLTGEVGLGKSTFVRRLLDTLPQAQVRTALVFNTFLQGEALLSAILRDFGLSPGLDMDEALAQLNQFLMTQRQQGRICLLVIDDAQNLDPVSLELIRLLCNLETDQEKLLQIVLAGQPELEVTLNGIGLRQLKSRIVKHVRLSGLRVNEVQDYFDMRITAAGASARVGLQPSAARLLYRATGGNMRHLHLLLDRCLYGLTVQGRGTIDRALVRAAIDDVAVRTAPAPLRALLRAALALGSVGLVALGMGAMASVWTSGKSSLSPSAEVPMRAPVAMPDVPVVHLPVDTMVDASRVCLDDIATRPGPEPLLWQQIPAGVVSQLRDASDLCLFQHGKDHWALWRDRPDRSALVAGNAASPAGLQLQGALVRHGVLGSADIDGWFGPRTSAAMHAFQAANGLSVTALPDPLTTLLLERMEPRTAVGPN